MFTAHQWVVLWMPDGLIPEFQGHSDCFSLSCSLVVPQWQKSTSRKLAKWKLHHRQDERWCWLKIHRQAVIDSHTDRWTDHHTDSETDRQWDKQTDSQMDSHADKQAGRLMDRATFTGGTGQGGSHVPWDQGVDGGPGRRGKAGYCKLEKLSCHQVQEIITLSSATGRRVQVTTGNINFLWGGLLLLLLLLLLTTRFSILISATFLRLIFLALVYKMDSRHLPRHCQLWMKSKKRWGDQVIVEQNTSIWCCYFATVVL